MGRRGPQANAALRETALALRLEGRPFSSIAATLGLSRQRVQQILSPPKAVRELVVEASHGNCTKCGVLVGASGHVHHRKARGSTVDDYNDIENLRLLCPSCHRQAHGWRDRLSEEDIAQKLAWIEADRLERGG